jgi:hypothetical protein
MRLTDEQIGAELYALRQTPGERFAAELDRRVEAGFHAEQTVKVPRALPWRRLLPAFGALAAAVVAVVVISNANQNDFRSTSNDSVRGAAPSETVAPAIRSQFGAADNAQTAVPPTAPAPLPNARPRNGRPQIEELSAALGLSTDPNRLQGASDGVVQVAARYDGFVDSSDVHIGGPGGHANFSLRIPAVHLRDALDDLSDLGRVVSRDEGSVNATGAYVDAGKAYREARVKVNSLLAQLRTSGPSEAAAIRRQLITARQELAAARAALRATKQRVTYAPVSVQIRADGDGSWSIGDAADDAVGVLEAIGGGALVTLAVVVPLAALLALGWLGNRELRRRRREAALD